MKLLCVLFKGRSVIMQYIPNKQFVNNDLQTLQHDRIYMKWEFTWESAGKMQHRWW